jgi:hypothetical protein
MSGSSAPLIYIYLDQGGIESLYAQITDRVEIEFIQTRSKEGRGGVGFTAGFGNLLTSLLGVKKLSAETKIEAVRGYIDEARTKLTIEHKLERLSEYLAKIKKCFASLEDATSRGGKGEVVYVSGVEKFDAPDFYPGRGGVHEINESGSMVFTIDRNYDPSDAYFKKAQCSFVMTASIRNFTRLHGYMGATSHEAIMFRGFSGTNIPLGVFGYVMRYSDSACQIKPYAVWLPNGYFDHA